LKCYIESAKREELQQKGKGGTQNEEGASELQVMFFQN
jgi:hypothetical protein